MARSLLLLLPITRLESDELLGKASREGMTCRIDRLVIGEDLVILSISGRITGQEVDMLRALLEQERKAVAIDLRDVRLVDREAVQLLALHETDGAEIRNCPLYVREWITREREAK